MSLLRLYGRVYLVFLLLAPSQQQGGQPALGEPGMTRILEW